MSTVCTVALLCFALTGQALAQTTADSYRKAGAAYFKAGKFRESVKAYQEVIRLQPTDTDAYQQLGEAFSRLGMNTEAAQAFEKSADLLVSGNGAPVAAPTPAAAQSTRNPAPQTRPQPSASSGQRKYKVGQRVEYVDGGRWFKAVITKVASNEEVANFGPYHVYYVHSLGYTWDKWVSDYEDSKAQLRPAGSGPTEPVPGGEENDDVLNAMRGATAAKPAQPAAKQYNCGVGAPITITGSGTYDGQRAQYEMSYGLARLHILGPSGRLVIDCD